MNQQNDQELLPAKIESGAGELSVAQSSTYALQEIQGAMILAKKFPRDIEAVWGKLMKSCQRETMAGQATYAFPRGSQTVSGPSVHLARVAAQAFGNIRWGHDVIQEDDTSITIRGWAWDIEENSKATADDRFKKLVYRKKGGWVVPDERDLRELVNRRAAILKRNCLLEILPRDLIEDAIGVCKLTLKSGIKDPAGESKRLIIEFGNIGVTVEMLKGYLGADTFGPDEVVAMREILNSIREGQATKADFFSADQAAKDQPVGVDLNNIQPGDASKHQGYDKQPENSGTKKDLFQ